MIMSMACACKPNHSEIVNCVVLYQILYVCSRKSYVHIELF